MATQSYNSGYPRRKSYHPYRTALQKYGFSAYEDIPAGNFILTPEREKLLITMNNKGLVMDGYCIYPDSDLFFYGRSESDVAQVIDFFKMESFSKSKSYTSSRLFDEWYNFMLPNKKLVIVGLGIMPSDFEESDLKKIKYKLDHKIEDITVYAPITVEEMGGWLK